MQIYCLLIAFAFGQILRNCPKPSEIKSKFIQDQFNITEFARGQRYYEVGYKDMTQPRICKCITSDKVFDYERSKINDTFTIECGGKPYQSDLVFNVTDVKDASFVGIWNQKGVPILSKLRFPDTVVDVGREIRKDGSLGYTWAVEFQCAEFNSVVVFYAFNFYSSVPTMQYYDEMYAAMINAGLERFITSGSKIQLVEHNSDCWYNK